MRSYGPLSSEIAERIMHTYVDGSVVMLTNFARVR